jgi:SSS family solute:Na+ symporter
VALVIAVFSATPLLGSLESAFQYIQNFTGFFTPGILVIFLVALFWPKATTLSVLNAALTSLALSIFIFYFFPEYPFIHRMAVVFFSSFIVCYLTSLIQGYTDSPKAIKLNDMSFATSKAFNVNTAVVIVILSIIYISLW